jgi:hypothetical protein
MPGRTSHWSGRPTPQAFVGFFGIVAGGPPLTGGVRLQKAGCLEMHKCTVLCRNIQRYWILRRICRSIRGPCAPLTWTFSGFILVLHSLAASFRWPSAGCREVHKCTVLCRNISRNILRYWILRRICRSISCSAKFLHRGKTARLSCCIVLLGNPRQRRDTAW